jgi:thioredoxin 1
MEAATVSTFDEIIGTSPVPVLVDLWAEWCGPCHALAPVLEEVDELTGDALRIVKVDVDAEPDIARRYDVMSFPTLLLFRDGAVVRRMIGARGKHHLLEELADVL